MADKTKTFSTRIKSKRDTKISIKKCHKILSNEGINMKHKNKKIRLKPDLF